MNHESSPPDGAAGTVGNGDSDTHKDAYRNWQKANWRTPWTDEIPLLVKSNYMYYSVYALTNL